VISSVLDGGVELPANSVVLINVIENPMFSEVTVLNNQITPSQL